MILSGKPVDGVKAKKIGLIDAVYPSEFLQERTTEFIETVLGPSTVLGAKAALVSSKRKAPMKSKFRPRGLGASLLEKTPVGRKLVYARSRRDLMRRTRGNYPAPLAALKVIRKTRRVSLTKGLSREAAAFSQLVAGTTSRNLIRLYHTSEALKRETGVAGVVPQRSVKATGVLGAGTYAFFQSGQPDAPRRGITRWNDLSVNHRCCCLICQGFGKDTGSGS